MSKNFSFYDSTAAWADASVGVGSVKVLIDRSCMSASLISRFSSRSCCSSVSVQDTLLGEIDSNCRELLNIEKFSVNDQEPITEKKKLVVFFAPSDTLAKSMVPMINAVSKLNQVMARTTALKDEGALRQFKKDGVNAKPLSVMELIQKKPDVLVLCNDWSFEARFLIDLFRSFSSYSICIQESVIDFGDPAINRMRWADCILVQGVESVAELRDRNCVVVGNPRYEHLEYSEAVNHRRAIVNCNFTYEIHENDRAAWLADVDRALNGCGWEYFISQHPRDSADLAGYRTVISSSADTVHAQIEKSSLLITRFSSLIHEALCIGRKVIYYNSHNEKMQYDFGFDDDNIYYCENYDQLVVALRKIEAAPMVDMSKLSDYLAVHCVSAVTKPSSLIAKFINLHEGGGGGWKTAGLTMRIVGYALRWMKYSLPIIRKENT